MLSSLDTFVSTKLGDEFTHRSATGGLLTICAYLIGFYLFVQEFQLYTTVERSTDLFVDNDDSELIGIHLDITFHRLPCGIISLDVENLIGEAEENIHGVLKTRLDAAGGEIGAEDTFETDQRSTEIPVWEKQRMAQQAEFERELLRQAEKRDIAAELTRTRAREEKAKTGRPTERPVRQVRKASGDEPRQKDKDGAGVRRRQLQAADSDIQQPAEPSILMKKGLAAEMHKHLAEVVEKEQEKKRGVAGEAEPDQGKTLEHAPSVLKPEFAKVRHFLVLSPDLLGG